MFAVVTADPDNKLHMVGTPSGVVQRTVAVEAVTHGQTCAFNSARQLLAVAMKKNCVFLYDPAHQRPKHKCFMAEVIHCLEFSHCGNFLLGGGASGSIYFWLVATGELLFLVRGHLRQVTRLSFAVDCARFVSSSDDSTVKVWALPTSSEASPIATFSGHTMSVRSCQFSPSGDLIASGSSDRTLKVFAPHSAHQILSFQFSAGISAVQWLTDDRLVVGCDDSTIHFVAVEKQCHQTVGCAKSGHKGKILALLPTKVQCQFMSACDSSVVLLWDWSKDSDAVVLFQVWGGIHGVCSLCFMDAPRLDPVQMKGAPNLCGVLAKFPTLSDGLSDSSIGALGAINVASRKRPRVALDEVVASRIATKKTDRLSVANSLLQEVSDH